MDASNGGYEEIIRRLDELKAGQATIRVEMLDLHTQAMVAIRQSNEVTLTAIETLNTSYQKNREDVGELRRRLA
jgi:hypothetical protein